MGEPPDLISVVLPESEDRVYLFALYDFQRKNEQLWPKSVYGS